MPEIGQTAGSGQYSWDGKEWINHHVPGAAPGYVPKQSTAAIDAPAEVEPSLSEKTSDLVKSIPPGAAMSGGTALITGVPTMASLGAKAVGEVGKRLPESIGDVIQRWSGKAEKALAPYTQEPVQRHFEEAYDKFAQPGYQLHRPTTSWGDAGYTAGSFMPALLAGGGGLASRLMTTGAGTIGSILGGEAASRTLGEGARPYAELGGAVVGARGANVPRRAVTPYPLGKAERAAADLVEAKTGGVSSAGQYTGGRRLKQIEADLLHLAPEEFKKKLESQPEVMSRALLVEGGAPAGRASIPADVALADTKADFKARQDALHAATTGPKTSLQHQSKFDQKFYDDINTIQQAYHGSGIQPNMKNLTPVDKAIQETFNDQSRASFDFRDPAKRGVRQGFGGEYMTKHIDELNAEAKRLAKAGQMKEATALVRIADAVHDNMERSLSAQGSPHAGKFNELRDQKIALEALEKAKPAGSKEPFTAEEVDKALGKVSGLEASVGREKTNRNSPVGQLASAGQDVLAPHPSPRSGEWLAYALGSGGGALLGHHFGANPIESAILGGVNAAVAQKLKDLPKGVAAKILFNTHVQDYLKNQKLPPGSHFDPSTAAALLSLQGTRTVAPFVRPVEEEK